MTNPVFGHDPHCECWFGGPCGPVDVDIEEISLEEGRALLDQAARAHLGMSGEEFAAAWDEGRFVETDTLPVQCVAALLPFARQEP